MPKVHYHQDSKQATTYTGCRTFLAFTALCLDYASDIQGILRLLSICIFMLIVVVYLHFLMFLLVAS